MTSPPTAAVSEPVVRATPVYRRKLFWVALLYFSEGLPLGVFFDIFPVYFRQQGVNLADIGLLSLLGLAWTVKFLWAPAIDWARHHRLWVSAANALMALFAPREQLRVSTNTSLATEMALLREQGFELVGGRLLPDAAGPSAQLMYQAIEPPVGTAKPERVTVYLRKPDSATPAAFAYERQGELGLFYWVEGDSAHGNATGYALAGTLPRERLLVLAEAIYRQGAQKP